MRVLLSMLSGAVVLGNFLAAFADELPTSFASAYRLYTDSVENAQFNDAERYSEIAYSFGLEKFGDDHPNTALLAFNYSRMLSITKERRKAADMATTAREIAERAHGKSSVELINFLETEAKSHLNANNFELAEEVADRALDILKEESSESSEKYGDMLIVSARAESRTGWGAGSKRKLELALDVYADSLGLQHPKVAAVKYDMGRYHSAWNRHDKAIQYFNDAIGMWSQDREDHLVDIGSARAFLVTSYTELGEIDKATEQCQSIGLEMVERGDGNADAEPLYRKVPRYPMSALEKGAEGRAQFSFTIDEFGFVKNVELESVDGRRDLARAAEAALSEWRYAPAVIDGQFVPRHDNQVIISFALEN